jgi:pimeloyl-ACP methyl ester carboxylesterase
MLVLTSEAWLSKRLRFELLRYCPRAVCAPLFARDRAATDASIGVQTAASAPVLILITWADLVDRTIADVQRAIDDAIARVRHVAAHAGVITVGLVPYGSYSDGSRCMHAYRSEPLDGGRAPVDTTDYLLRRWEQRTSRYDLVFCPMALFPGRRGNRQHASALQATIRIGRGLADETRAKVPSYFSRYALTLRADTALDVNASSARQIVRWLADHSVHAVGRTIQRAGRVVYVHSRMAWPAVCASSHDGGVPLAIGDIDQPLNALDTLFNELVYDEYHCHGAPVAVGRCPESEVCDLDASHLPALLRGMAASRCREWETSYEDVGALRDLDLDQVAALHARERHRDAFPSSEADDAATPVRYREGGSGDVVLFLPPLGIGIEYYKPALQSLLHGFRVIVWHPRAKSPSNARSWVREDLSRYIDDICHVLEHERVTRCHIVTWCGGARLLPKLLDARGFEILSLVLMAPLIGGRDVFTPMADGVQSICRQLVDESIDVHRFLREATRRVREAPSALDQFAATDGVQKSPLEYHPIGFFSGEMFNDAEATKDWAAATLENVADMSAAYERLRTFDGPTLVVLGTHDGLIVYARARELVATMRHATLATVHGGNHYFVVEHGRAVTNLLRTFLRRGSIGDGGSPPCHGARIRIDAPSERRLAHAAPAVVAAGGPA